MKKYKQLIIGIIIGVMVASVVPVGAAIEEYILKKSPHKLAVNGEYWPEGTLPMMIYQDGYNYIPAATFRGICENMNIPFAWDREKEEIQIGETKQGDENMSNDNEVIEMDDGSVMIRGEKYYHPMASKPIISDIKESNVNYTFVRTSENDTLDFVKWTYLENNLKKEILIAGIPIIRFPTIHGIERCAYIEWDYYINNILPLAK
jgi:hypothetical protein